MLIQIETVILLKLSKILPVEDFKILSYSNLIDSTKNVDQAVNDIKHFVVKYDKDNEENFTSTFHKDKIIHLREILADLNNYIVKLDDIEDIFTRVEDSLARSTELDGENPE